MKAALVAFILGALFFAAVVGEVGAPSVPLTAPRAIRLQSRPAGATRPAPARTPGEVERKVREDNSGPGSVNSGRDEDSEDDRDDDDRDNSGPGSGGSGSGSDNSGSGSDNSGRG